jgi:4-aminobutyrate aminotransferase/(S)-3-amino-2-methylpropionate transaminase
MCGQPPVVWNRAQGFQVYDAWGNQWIDWSSGVLTANAGHGRREIVDAIREQAGSELLTNYCFPSAIRARLVERLGGLLPEPLKKVFLLTTGSETVKCAIKLCRTHGVRAGGSNKHVIVSFDRVFHGRTLGSEQAGGIPPLKAWIVNLDAGFVQVPSPDGYWVTDTSSGRRRCDPRNLSGGKRGVRAGGIHASPAAMVHAAGSVVGRRRSACWIRPHGHALGIRHYSMVPDLALFGKGMASSLPISAVAGRLGVMDLHPAGSMTSTHAGNPVCCAAAPASIDLVVNENLSGNSRRMGELLQWRLRDIASRFLQIGAVAGKGLVAGVVPGTKDPDDGLAWRIVERCAEKGVLMSSPAGVGGGTVKISPLLIINGCDGERRSA